MELREIRSFVVLAEELHFGKAARLLHLSQPALSKQILRLEEELGGPLLSRGRHGAALTSLGRQFLPGARSLVRDSDNLVAWTRRAALGEVGQLRLGFGFHTFELVPRLLVKLRRNLPEVEITLRDMSTAEQTEGLRSERIDLGFVRLPAPKDFQTLPVSSDRVALVSRSGVGLPAQLSLAACKNEPFVLISRERSPSFYNHVLRLCAKHGFLPRIVQEVPEATTALALVRAGLGLTLIGQSFETSHFAGVRFHNLKDPEARWEVGAAWRPGDSNPVLHRFLTLLRKEMQK
jgi:DNA-binding transcriptional LysR family regulator